MSEKCQWVLHRPGYSRDMSEESTVSPDLPPYLPPYLLRVDSPIGRLELTSDGTAVTSLLIAKNGELPLDGIDDMPTGVLDTAATQLAEYFAGERREFDVPVAPRGTVFQKQVWEQLSGLGWGEVASYGDIGRATGRPTAGRAVGGAVGANPITIIVPCHRVLAGNGRITGYSGGNGIPTKVWLLDHEGIPHSV